MRIVVIGCGRIGAHVARQLAAGGCDVCVVDQDSASLARLGRGFSGRTVTGTGFDESVLQQAQVAQADGVAVLTNDDATNFMVARAVALLFSMDHVTVRVNDPEFASLYAELGLNTIDIPELVLGGVRAILPQSPPQNRPRLQG